MAGKIIFFSLLLSKLRFENNGFTFGRKKLLSNLEILWINF